MRTDLKNKEYFEQYFVSKKALIDRGFLWLKDGEVNESQKESFKMDLLSRQIYFMIAHYTAGVSKEDLRPLYNSVLRYVPEAWSSEALERGGDPYGSVLLNQFTLSAYDEMLWMLSLGHLLDIPESDFTILVSAIDKYEVKDLIFETIIAARVASRQPLTSESYREHRMVPESFTGLRKAIDTPGKSAATALIKQFIKKEWYKGQKDSGWYNNHKSKHDTFFGYWSFETAAIVKIKGLNKDDFKDLPYFPYDLI